MAEPKLQIEQRVERLENAVSTMASWLVQAQTGFGVQDAEGIEKILRGEKSEKPDMDDLAKAEADGVDVENEAVIPADAEESKEDASP